MLVSGGLGPTHDDRTVELVAAAAGRALVLDPELERQIEQVSRDGRRAPAPAVRRLRAGRAQAGDAAGPAHVPVGLAGTAPGLVLEAGACAVVVLPGPPGELQRLWPRALETEPVRRVLERASPPARRVLRLFGVSESAVARALAEAGGDGDGVEATICARDFEIHVDLLVEPGAEDARPSSPARLRTELERYVFAEDERSVEEIVLDALPRARADARRRRSRARAGSSPRGSPPSRARATSPRAASWRTRTR